MRVSATVQVRERIVHWEVRVETGKEIRTDERRRGDTGGSREARGTQGGTRGGTVGA